VAMLPVGADCGGHWGVSPCSVKLGRDLVGLGVSPGTCCPCWAAHPYLGHDPFPEPTKHPMGSYHELLGRRDQYPPHYNLLSGSCRKQ